MSVWFSLGRRRRAPNASLSSPKTRLTAVEDAALVRELLAGLADALLAWLLVGGVVVWGGWGVSVRPLAGAGATVGTPFGTRAPAPRWVGTSPVHSARKLSTVLGTTSPQSPITMRPVVVLGFGLIWFGRGGEGRARVGV